MNKEEESCSFEAEIVLARSKKALTRDDNILTKKEKKKS